MHEFTFDVTLYTTIRVNAKSAKTARKMLAKAMYGAEANLGCWPNGDPILCTMCQAEPDEDDLVEIDGEAV